MSLSLRSAAVGIVSLLACPPGWPYLADGSLDVHWNAGAQDCGSNPTPPLQVHQYNSRTYILRESLCATFEAPFMYLLIGSRRALLIDTGDVAAASQMPLAQTVLELLPGDGPAKLPLIVAHTHRHMDHRAGDPQFQHLPNVELVPFDLAGVQKYYGFTHWPDGVAQVDLGDRTVDVLPTPGHESTHVSFYDRNTALFLSGDFLLPGRLLISDAAADLASARRVAAFVKDRPVSHVLGGHIELGRAGRAFPWGSQFHPDERPLQMTKADLLALPEALSGFNGFYAERGGFLLMNPMRNLLVVAAAAAVVLAVLAGWTFRFLRRRIAARRQRSAPVPP
ncbi:MAG TPA: MBL fold metallo-hydrolase [Steroidobacteraceae bacterium]|jgi:glyoxylase-like metal-dependent hydrolase (beta-lactamase superfamily II)|nr:MBL fold metallo-hydrolase [Steroidobacteraceae bacterium]